MPSLVQEIGAAMFAPRGFPLLLLVTDATKQGQEIQNIVTEVHMPKGIPVICQVLFEECTTRSACRCSLPCLHRESGMPARRDH